jgi:hypothetical protein
VLGQILPTVSRERLKELQRLVECVGSGKQYWITRPNAAQLGANVFQWLSVIPACNPLATTGNSFSK